MLAHTAMAAAAIAVSISLQKVSQKPTFFSAQNNNHRPRMVVFARGAAGEDGFTRVAMDIPGAYQLIDNETGEKFIIWGGQENDPQTSPIPSQQILSWKPFTSRSKLSSSSTTQIGNSDTMVGSNQACSRGPTRSFGRLKAQRIRDLVKKSHRKKQEGNESDNMEQKETRDMMQNTLTGEHIGQFEVAVDQEIREFPICNNKPTKDQESGIVSTGPDVSLSRPLSYAFRGWGVKKPTHNYSPKMEDISPKRWNTNDRNNFFSRKSFKNLGCQDYVIESLRSLHFVRSSHIQSLAFGPVTEGKSCIIADQSGSGKTLAYLLPLVQRLREEELQGLDKRMSQNPRVVVLVPTAELASQVLSICRSLSKCGVPFRSMVVTGGFRQRTQLENLKQELDVLIATPGRFLFLMKQGYLQLTNLKCAVLDEVDILFNDEDFELALQSLMNNSPTTTQYLFVTATLPVDIYNNLVEAFPDCNVIMGPGMHRTSPSLEEVLVDCSGDETTEKTPEVAFLNKKNALLQLVEESPVTKTIVFCNKIETCRKVENALKRYDRKGSAVRVLPFHAALDQETRLANLKEFCSPQVNEGALFLVCTDRVSRGIDFAGVDHVVLFDFPRDPSEYVRRVGRTARGAGGKGKAFIFVVGKQVSLARRIIDRNRKGHPVHDVPSAYELIT